MIVLADTITKVNRTARGQVVVCGSHGGRYPGYIAAHWEMRAVILNDAGVGRDQAGVGALPYLAEFWIPAAAVDAGSCVIGDAADMMARGVISHANVPAQAVGVRPGLACAVAAEALLASTGQRRSFAQPPLGEHRTELATDGRRIVLVDSASLVEPGDAGQIVVTGSHGGLIGGDPAMALRTDAFAAVFNDAGRPDGPGTTRLPALAARGIAAVTVAAGSARIGEAASSYADGVISVANDVAAALGAQPGQRARDWLHACAAR